ncbi:hypothetical protein [Streptoalloteichus hindustanus]|uniref:Uncharacterized protein n=1 Tax=Streptoalloteichus hindustanus TaxID=2017 RepID=A0A1M5CFL4_STRHI|nr:hypothetical protein [Streptoalloteichus hindustanus]SHF53407.1 hypothetical protein SAMN05444320_1042 [Streptoalloteichus hindustanus]
MNVPPRWHLVSFYRIDQRGRRVRQHQKILDDDYWHTTPCGPESHAVDLAHELFFNESATSGDRWVITVDVLTGERGTVDRRLCEVTVTVPSESVLAPQRDRTLWRAQAS